MNGDIPAKGGASLISLVDLHMRRLLPPSLRHWLKKHTLGWRMRDRMSPAVQIAQRDIWLRYRDYAHSGTGPPLAETGFRVFSQYEEDGLLLYIFAVIGIGEGRFVDIGSHDGVNSNCANLAIHFGWHGLFLDADPVVIERGRHFYARYPDPWSHPPVFCCARATREEINTVVAGAGFTGEIDLLSIDIDGNDYWIWDALEVVQPRVVIIETHVEFGTENIVVPYDPDYTFPGRHPVYHGASPEAMTRLARRKGYRLVGSNAYGHNALFVRQDLGEALLPEVPSDSLLRHPATRAGMARFEPIRDWAYFRPE